MRAGLRSAPTNPGWSQYLTRWLSIIISGEARVFRRGQAEGWRSSVQSFRPPAWRTGRSVRERAGAEERDRRSFFQLHDKYRGGLADRSRPVLFRSADPFPVFRKEHL